MRAADTIAAVASNAGYGGVAIVRLSGAESLAIARTLAPWLPEQPPPRLLHYGALQGHAGVLDTGFVVAFPEGRSYTGELSVELQIHGGAANVGRVLSALVAAGARLAERGEFSRRAFLNGRIDLAQAEAVADLVSARTERGLDLAQAQLAGALSARVRQAMDALLDLQAGLEVQIDFVDEDLGDALTRRFDQPLRSALAQVTALRRTYTHGRVLSGAARVVLAGAPNAGKSSLFNALVGDARAIVTPVAGTTRDYLEELVDLGGVTVTLVDTAGLRDGVSDPVEAEGIARSRRVSEAADLLVWLHDHDASGAPPGALVVATKADLRPHAGPLTVSALTGQGLDTLRAAIVGRLLGASGTTPQGDGAVVTNARHHAALCAAEAALEAALATPEEAGPELLAVDVREAVWQLGLIVGTSSTEDLLDRVFSRFCIGK